MKIMLVGAAGQLGWEMQRSARAGDEIIPSDYEQLDITDGQKVMAEVEALSPDWIVNAAAYTAVDKAESDVDKAYAINADGAEHLAKAAVNFGARLVQVSTDFIFDGQKGSPYVANDQPNPLSVYGASKLAGETRVLAVLGKEALIIRTAWVYSSHGSNFVKTMLRLMQERDELNVIEDQVGTPTSAAGLAKTIYAAMDHQLTGIYHWTDAGIASWYDFAQAVYEYGHELGLLDKTVTINPIPTTHYPTPAKRPGYSALDKNILREKINDNGQHWRVALKKMLKELKHG